MISSVSLINDLMRSRPADFVEIGRTQREHPWDEAVEEEKLERRDDAAGRCCLME